MLKLNKLAIIWLTLFSALPLLKISSQQRTYSPLSKFGIGETQSVGYQASSGMGYTGIAMRSEYGLSNLNPASLTSLDSLSFYFEGGMTHFWQDFSANGTSGKNSNIVFDYIALGFSVSPKFSSTVGFKPLTSTGYNYETITTHFDNDKSYSQLEGSGNITQAYFGFAYMPIKNLSVGANISYIFGSLQNISKASFSDATILKHGIFKETRISSVTYDFGAQYEHQLAENKSIIIGATFRPKIGLKGDTTLYVAKGNQFGDKNNLFQQGSFIDTIQYAQNNISGNEFEYASSFGIGISYKIKDKLNIGFDYLTELWSAANYIDKNIELQNSSRYSLGAEFIPNDRAANIYLARIRYRAGAYYQNENFRLGNNDVYNYGITFGVGLPLKRSKTAINIAMELGKRNVNGTDGLKQSYGKVTANFSLHEFWFVKRKFD